MHGSKKGTESQQMHLNYVYDEQSISLYVLFVPGIYSQVKNKEERLFRFDPLSDTA